MKHWTFEIGESDSGEILISAEGSDGSCWQEWVNKKEGKLYKNESVRNHKVTPIEDWAIRTEINLMLNLLKTFFKKDMQDVESYRIFEGNSLNQFPDPIKAYWARETVSRIGAKDESTMKEIPPVGYEWENILDYTGENIIGWNEAELMMDDDLRENLHKEIAPCSQQIFYIIYCMCHEKKFECPISIG